MKTSPKIVLSGGGTGGHIFPAVAIADEFRKRYPDAEFLFIGAQDKMEMQKVPKAGYSIKGLWISGLNRSRVWANVLFPFKLFSSLYHARKYIKNFQPDLAIGTGGYASGPALYMASKMKVPIFLQEQNSFPGITNKALKNKASQIFVAYDQMERFFPEDKIINAGNPVRESLFSTPISKEEAKKHLGLDPNKVSILNIGGSLGSRTLNNAWVAHAKDLDPEKTQLYWQTGSTEYEKIKNDEVSQLPHVIVEEFIQDMSWAYAAADLIVSRAGAIAISELCMAGKATILVPFPFAAEDHQTKNAENLVGHEAAVMVKDDEMEKDFWPLVQQLLGDEAHRNVLAKNIKKLAKPQATEVIVNNIIKTLS